MAAINIVFDGPPSPEAGRFVEVELDDGRSVKVGEWIKRDDGYWALRIDALPSDDEPHPNWNSMSVAEKDEAIRKAV